MQGRPLSFLSWSLAGSLLVACAGEAFVSTSPGDPSSTAGQGGSSAGQGGDTAQGGQNPGGTGGSAGSAGDGGAGNGGASGDAGQGGAGTGGAGNSGGDAGQGGDAGAAGNSGGAGAGQGGSAGANGGNSGAGQGGAGEGGAGNGGAEQGGSAGSGGSEAGAGGSGGEPAIPCPGPCGSETYCNEEIGQCVPCSDTGRLRFTPPEPLALAPGARWPRPIGGNGMVYVALRANGVEGPWVTGNFENDAGQPMTSVPDSQSTSSGGPPLAVDRPERAPFLGALQNGGGTPPWNDTYNFTFDRTLTDGRRVLRRGKWNNNAANFYQLWWSSTLEGPYNTANSDNYSAAVVNSTGRAFWMTTRFGGIPALATGIFGSTPAAAAPPVSVALPLGDNCVTEDMAPWINAAGDLLVLSARNNPGGCTAGRDPWVVVVNAAGQPIGQVAPRRLADLASPDPAHDDGEVAFSGDLCQAFLASNRGGSYQIYRARRR